MGKFEQPRGMTPRDTQELDTQALDIQQTTQPAPKPVTRPAAPAPAPSQKPKNTKRTGKIVVISVCVAVLLILAGVLIWMMSTMGTQEEDNRIHSNVYAGGVNLGGMTVEEAKSALHLATDNTFSRKDMVVRLPDDSIVLSPAGTCARLDVDAVVEAAFQYGRNGQSSGSGYTIALLPYLNLDLNYIQTTISDFCESYSSVMSQPTVELVGTRPEFDPEDPDRTVEHQVLVLTMGTPDYVLDADDLYDRVLDAYSLNQLSVSYEAPSLTEPPKPDAQTLFEQLCTEPQDAFVNESTFEVTAEVYGYGFDVQKLEQLIAQAEYGQVIELELDFLMPDITVDDLSGELFLDSLGSFISINNVGNSTNRNANLQISCDAIDGFVLKAGEEFSFNDILGRLTAEKGYKKAPAIVGGKEVSTLGGGVSQTASALYYCALMADLEILERHNHTYAVSFVPLGFDASVEWGVEDLRFRNNTGNPIRISANASDGTVAIELVGTNKLSYNVELKSEVITELAPETIYQTMAKDNILGYKDGDVLVEAITGYVINTSMNRLDKVTGVVLSSKSIDLSHYSKRDQQVVSIEADPTAPTDPVEPTDPEATVDPNAPSEEAPTVDAPTEAPTENIPTEAPTEDIPTEAPTEDIPTEAPTEAPVEDIPTETPEQVFPTEEIAA